MDNDTGQASLAAGVAVIADSLATLPAGPGVYRMMNRQGEALYVGKAKNLKKRVASYTKPERQSIRIRRMIAQTQAVEFVITHTEAEALLLEANLIKQLKPRYNILLRDDKSFPFIHITGHHDFPQVTKHRGKQGSKGDYFGPFASGSAVNEAIITLQKAFLLRNCSDSVFAARTRPCLQYQIRRCTAPCVGKVTRADYAQQVKMARDFLSGKSREIQDALTREMNRASDRRDFEEAAVLRDRIRALTSVQSRQTISMPGLGDADVFALLRESGESCVYLSFFRGGQNYGGKSYFPRTDRDDSPEQILGAFLAQFYAGKPVPPLILASHVPEGAALLAEALALKSGRRIRISCPEKGARKMLMTHTLERAAGALKLRLADTVRQEEALSLLAEALGLSETPERIEIFDNSHIGGSGQVGAMVVATAQGFDKKSYRKFNIRGRIAPGDDYAMMREVLTRRFRNATAEPEEQAPDGDAPPAPLPDLVIVDGGAGQLKAALETLADLGLGALPVAGIAKGPDRNAGRERIFMAGKKPFQLPPDDPALFFLQRLRDEAHRFAIGAQRNLRKTTLTRSALDSVPGIGAARKKALLQHFGSAQAVASAGLADLEAVPGISRAMAKKIYDYFHQDG